MFLHFPAELVVNIDECFNSPDSLREFDPSLSRLVVSEAATLCTGQENELNITGCTYKTDFQYKLN